MVQLSPLLHLIPAISQAIHSSSTSGGNGLAVRQSINTGDLPPACQSSCGVVNTLADCTTTSCECTTSVGTQLEDCMNCLVSNVPSVEPTAQEAIDEWNQDCNGHLQLGKSGGAIALSTGNMATCVVALLGIASAFLCL